MKTSNVTTIVEFEVIAPTNDLEKVGEKLTLNKSGEYCPDKGRRGYNLLFLLDHTMHYRISKMMMKGKTYIIPADRKKNYITDMHPDSLPFRKIPQRYDTLSGTSVPSMRKSDNGSWVEFNEVKHLF